MSYQLIDPKSSVATTTLYSGKIITKEKAHEIDSAINSSPKTNPAQPISTISSTRSAENISK